MKRMLKLFPALYCVAVLLSAHVGFAQRTQSITLVPDNQDAEVAALVKIAHEQTNLPHELRFGVIPLKGDSEKIMEEASHARAGNSLPLWQYSAISTRNGSQGQGYTGLMVGANEFTTNGTTTVTAQIVPLIVVMQDGTTFDPTIPDPNCAGGNTPLTLVQQSPLVLPTNFTMNGVFVGNTQYGDAFQRANIWTAVSKNGGTYHLLLNVVTLNPIRIQAGAYGNYIKRPCGPFGFISFSALDAYLRQTVIPNLAAQGVGPSTFPIFLLYNMSIICGANGCELGGYHTAYKNNQGLYQTYSPSAFDLTGYFGPNGQDTVILSHEIGEWIDDPLGVNATPPWGHIGQVTGCQANLEVGDPLSGTNIPPVQMPNGYTYHLQELAFASWYFGAPSTGTGGLFSDNGTLVAAQGPCS
jgi:hypothetical protein